LEINKNIKKQWERLFTYYKQKGLLIKECKGATQDDINKLYNEFGLNLPDAFVDSCRICDERYIFDTNEKKGWIGEDDLYSLGNTYYDFYNLFVINKEMRIYYEFWRDEWIVFYDNGTWISAILDINTGKVYCFDNETGEYVLWTNTYEEWLEMAVDEVVQYGELRLETMEKLLGIEE